MQIGDVTGAGGSLFAGIVQLIATSIFLTVLGVTSPVLALLMPFVAYQISSDKIGAFAAVYFFLGAFAAGIFTFMVYIHVTRKERQARGENLRSILPPCIRLSNSQSHWFMGSGRGIHVAVQRPALVRLEYGACDLLRAGTRRRVRAIVGVPDSPSPPESRYGRVAQAVRGDACGERRQVLAQARRRTLSNGLGRLGHAEIVGMGRRGSHTSKPKP